jgi:hypothetical protein
MAYTFDRINTLFRGKDDQANVMGDKRPKTVAAGDVSSSDRTGGEAATPQSFAAPSAAAIQKNVSRARTPEFTTRIRGQIEAGNTGLNNASSQYSQGYENKDYGVSADKINSAVSGNAGDLASVQTRMATPKYGQVEAFKPEVDTEIEDAALLGSEGGTKRLLARQGGNKYSAGEAAFDVSLLRRNQGFNRIADELSRGGKELSQKATRLQSELPQAAQQIADTKYAAGTDEARNYLGNLGKGIIDPVTAKAAEINATRAGLRTTPNQAFISQKDAAARAEAEKELSLLNPRAVKLLGETGIDPRKYYGVGRDVSASDLYSQDDAFKFNNIQQILGGKDLISAGQGAGEDEYFDDPNYTSGLVSRASTLRGVKDTDARTAIDKINAGTSSRAGEYNQRIDSEEKDKFGRIIESILSANPNLRSSFVDQLKGLNPADYINERSPVSYSDVYTPEEAAQINAYYDDLGSQSPKVSSKNWQQGVSINEAAINQMLADQLASEERLKNSVGTISPTPGGVTIEKGTSQEKAAADYVTDRFKSAKDYVGDRNPFRRRK